MITRPRRIRRPAGTDDRNHGPATAPAENTGAGDMAAAATFVLARLAEDAAGLRIAADTYEQWSGPDAEQLLVDCAAKRLIVEDFLSLLNAHRTGWDVRSPRDYPVRALALPYADHPDYQPGWRP